MASAISSFTQAQALARARNQSRLNQATSLYDSIIAQYSGGAASPLMTSVNKQLEIGGRKAMSSGMEKLISSGLSGGTMAASLGANYEENVAAPTRLSALDTIAQRLAAAQMAKAGVLERVEDTVDTSMLPGLMSAANSGGGQTSYGFGADAKQISASSYLQPKASSSELYYGSSNPNAYNPYKSKTAAIRDNGSVKNIASNAFSNINYKGGNSDIYYGSSNKNAATLQNYTPIYGKTSQGNITQYVDW